MAPYDDVTHAFVGPEAEVLLLLKALQMLRRCPEGRTMDDALPHHLQGA